MRNRLLLDPPRSLDPHGRVAESIVENRTRIAAQERNTAPPRIDMALAAGWANYGGTWAICTYYSDRGRVYLEGMAGAPAAGFVSGSLWATLPVGYRPAVNSNNLLMTMTSVGVARVDIFPSGNIVLYATIPAAGAGTHWASFGDLSFRV